MARIEALSSEKTPEGAKELIDEIQKKMGSVPNIFKSMANSPVLLSAFLELNNAAEKTSLDSALREKIALAVAQENRCTYCLSAHTAIAQSIGMTKDDVFDARKGEDEDPRTSTILKFCRFVVSKHGDITDYDMATLKSQGVSDKEVCEIFLMIMINMFTNYFNKAMLTEVDFPLAKIHEVLP